MQSIIPCSGVYFPSPILLIIIILMLGGGGMIYSSDGVEDGNPVGCGSRPEYH